MISAIISFVLLYQKRMLANKKDRSEMERSHQKQLLDNSLEIAEYERQKIAANLHDEIGIILSVLKLNLSRIKKNAGKPEAIDEIISESNEQIDSSIEIVRQIHRDIMPPTLMKAGFIKGMKELCRQLSVSSGLQIRFNSDDESLAMEKIRELQLYRLTKEVLNNIVRHAKPRFVEINIYVKENRLNLLILHNGSGISTEEIKEKAKISKGLGLKSILTRSELLNAKIDFSILGAETSQVKIEMGLSE